VGLGFRVQGSGLFGVVQGCLGWRGKGLGFRVEGFLGLFKDHLGFRI